MYWFTMRFEVHSPLLQSGQTAETTVRVKSSNRQDAESRGRAKLTKGNWAVGRLTSLEVKEIR